MGQEDRNSFSSPMSGTKNTTSRVTVIFVILAPYIHLQEEVPLNKYATGRRTASNRSSSAMSKVPLRYRICKKKIGRS